MYPTGGSLSLRGIRGLAPRGHKDTVGCTPHICKGNRVEVCPRRRYPILLAFLQQALLHHTDVAVELYDQCVWEYRACFHFSGQDVE